MSVKTNKTTKAQVAQVKEEQQVMLAPKTAQDIPATIEALKKQLAALKGTKDEEVKTDVQYDDSTNIKQVTSVKKLLEIMSSIRSREAAYQRELIRYPQLADKIAAWDHKGKSLNQWQKIIDKAVNELFNKAQIEKIQGAISQLEEHLSAEDKLKKTLDNVYNSATSLIN